MEQIVHIQSYSDVGYVVLHRMVDTFQFKTPVVGQTVLAECANAKVRDTLFYIRNFNLSDAFKIYPSVGYALAFVHSEDYKISSTKGETVREIVHDSENDTDGGIQLGLGLQYNLNDNWFLAGEYKYQPGILGDGHVVMGSIGFKF